MRNQRRQTAIHEAGHAVIGRVLGISCEEASIVANEDDGSAGYSITKDIWLIWDDWEARGKYRGDELRSIYRGRLMTLMAGAEAENVLAGGCQGGDDDDRRWIEYMAEDRGAQLPDDLWRRYEPKMRRQTRRLVRKHRDKIECVADALLKHETLTTEEIDALFDASVLRAA